VELFNEAGVLQARLRYVNGQMQKRDELYASGQPARVDEVKGNTRTERRFAEDGQLRREVVWQIDGKSAFKTVEKEFSEKGSLTRDQRWTDRKLASDASFYLNGQPKSRSVFGREGETEVVDVTDFHDNGQPARTGRYGAAGRYDRTAMGKHQAFDAAGKLVAESVYDARGRINRERAWDESGKLLRDDEVFEDGSRKAYAK
jgi:antitoxin component YwqK of YwqJK toxin-antitoxin module